MSQLLRKNNPSLKIVSNDPKSLAESKKNHVSQSVPLTPIERNINVTILLFHLKKYILIIININEAINL